MDQYINISLNCSPIIEKEFDLRVPVTMTLKELLQIVSESYGLGMAILNPSARNMQSGEVLASTSCLGILKDGALLQLENL